MNYTRCGTVLIIVAGISALLASLTLTFLARMRADASEMQSVARNTQARLMLMAGCNWIQEASRIGWRPSMLGDTTPLQPGDNTETFGWIDVRDNKIGPKFLATGADDDRLFPINSYRRFPMYVMERPPYAIELTVAYNPIATPISPNSVSFGDPSFGMPYLRYPDPMPAVPNGYEKKNPLGNTVSAANFTDWEQGKPTPRPESVNKSWFRIWRESGATFLITCGTGGTQGYRSWDEIPPAARLEFHDDPTYFAMLAAAETRMWFRVEWSAAVMGMDYHLLDHSLGRNFDHWMVWPMNAGHSTAGHEYRTQTHARNMGGTIRWVQRLRQEPVNW